MGEVLNAIEVQDKAPAKAPARNMLLVHSWSTMSSNWQYGLDVMALAPAFAVMTLGKNCCTPNKIIQYDHLLLPGYVITDAELEPSPYMMYKERHRSKSKNAPSRMLAFL